MRMPICVLAVVLLSAAFAAAAEPVKSGLQPGEKITTIFEPLNVTGPFAGEPHCLVCENGANPVAMVFAREASPALLKLAAALDKATVKHQDQSMGSFVVVLSQAEGLDKRLAAAAKTHALQQIVLSIDAPAGPEGFNVAQEADVTVVLYRDHEVKANHAFRQGELSEQAIQRIVADVAKIVPAN